MRELYRCAPLCRIKTETASSASTVHCSEGRAKRASETRRCRRVVVSQTGNSVSFQLPVKPKPTQVGSVGWRTSTITINHPSNISIQRSKATTSQPIHREKHTDTIIRRRTNLNLLKWDKIIRSVWQRISKVPNWMLTHLKSHKRQTSHERWSMDADDPILIKDASD